MRIGFGFLEGGREGEKRGVFFWVRNMVVVVVMVISGIFVVMLHIPRRQNCCCLFFFSVWFGLGLVWVGRGGEGKDPSYTTLLVIRITQSADFFLLILFCRINNRIILL